jgi:hypothetical protein
LEEALAKASAVAGPEATVVEASRLRRGGIGGFFAKERFEVTVEPGAAEMAMTPIERVLEQEGPASRDLTQLSTEQASFAELVARLANDTRATSRAVAATARVLRPSLDAPVPTGDAHQLLDAMHALPPAPPLPTGSGEVLAVVGAREAALVAACELAAEAGIEARRILLASADDDGADLWPGQLVPSVDAATDVRCVARFRPTVTIVAVVAPVGRTTSLFARRVLEALEPTGVWAAVDAGRKAEDVRAWADALGGVDALVVTGLAETTTPATVLQPGLPIARVDGRPSNPALLTAMLLDEPPSLGAVG